MNPEQTNKRGRIFRIDFSSSLYSDTVMTMCIALQLEMEMEGVFVCVHACGE